MHCPVFWLLWNWFSTKWETRGLSLQGIYKQQHISSSGNFHNQSQHFGILWKFLNGKTRIFGSYIQLLGIVKHLKLCEMRAWHTNMNAFNLKINNVLIGDRLPHSFQRSVYSFVPLVLILWNTIMISPISIYETIIIDNSY